MDIEENLNTTMKMLRIVWASPYPVSIAAAIEFRDGTMMLLVNGPIMTRAEIMMIRTGRDIARIMQWLRPQSNCVIRRDTNLNASLIAARASGQASKPAATRSDQKASAVSAESGISGGRSVRQDPSPVRRATASFNASTRGYFCVASRMALNAS